jgi:phospho-N-acetylmuramoyl-pentapeptide-transferase
MDYVIPLLWVLGMGIAYRMFIRWAHRRQMNQVIYEDAPQRHHQKSVTPTMGGVVILGSFVVGMIGVNAWTPVTVWVVMTTLLFGGIGLIDDGLSLRRKSNKGMSAKQKLGMQVGVAVVAMIAWHYAIAPLIGWQWLLYGFLLVGASNATNLTDGLDGLLGSVMLITMGGLWWVCQAQGLPVEGRMVVVMMVSLAVFLVFNWHPARLFMGDTGSLLLGGFFAATAVATGQWPIMIGLGAIYIVETLSVMIQVIGFRYTRKRVFLMSPLHHHFELMGLSERVIVLLFAAFHGVCTWIQLSRYL